MCAGVMRIIHRRNVWSLSQDPSPFLGFGKCLTTSTAHWCRPKRADIDNEDFWDKNKRLSRPMSPHLTIYKPQMTSLLSVTHRGTGVALSALFSGLGIGMLGVQGTFPQYVQALESTHLGAVILFSAKFILAFPFMFHFLNGLRHLAWDLGFGFSIKGLYASGYAVCGLSFVLSAAAACL